jgi:hypothetical protein
MSTTFNQLTTTITSTVTNGWDAVCAMDSSQISAVFLQQYLQNGPTNPSEPLVAIGQVSSGESFWLLNVLLGPPDVSFPAGLPPDQAQLSMYLIRGVLIGFNPNTKTTQSVVQIRPNVSQLSGSLSLSKVQGTTNQLGVVTIQLCSGAWQPQIEGVDPSSQLAQGIAQAIQSFFANNAAAYQAGIVAESSVPKALQPTSFSFYTQPNPNQAGDGCLLMLITTTGTPGPQQPIEPYPIASGYSAGLIVSNQVLFNQLMPSVLTQEFSKIGSTFAGQQGSNGYTTVSSGGSINLGEFSLPNTATAPYSSDSNQNAEPVQFPAGGFTIGPSSGNLSASWSASIKQDITWTAVNPYTGYPYQTINTADFQADYSETATPSVDSTTDVISFSGSGSSSVKETNPPSWWEKVFGQQDVGGMLTSSMQSTLGDVLNGLTLPGVDVFALANLLFPKGQALSLQYASVPCDLIVNGQINAPVAVSPSSVNLQPGATQQFTAAIGGQASSNVLWEISPAGYGSISSSGLYTAPPSVPQAQAVVVTAIDNANTQDVGSAMALVYESAAETGLAVTPGQLVLTPGQNFNLVITNSSGQAEQVTCTISPNVGTISQDFGNSNWNYTAPDKIDGPQTVVVTATSTSNSSLTGTAKIVLLPPGAITVTPASASVGPNQSVQLTAYEQSVTDYEWAMYPTGAGSIQVATGDTAKATYTAPASAASGTLVMVAVYSIGSVAALGVAAITLTA